MSEKKITELTPEQTANLSVCRDEWLAIGLNCEPCDFPAAKAAAIECYKSADLEPPDWWFVFDSPYSAAVGAMMLQVIWTNVKIWDEIVRNAGARLAAEHGFGVPPADVVEQLLPAVQACLPSAALEAAKAEKPVSLTEDTEPTHDEITRRVWGQLFEQMVNQIIEIQHRDTLAAVRGSLDESVSEDVYREAWREAWHRVLVEQDNRLPGLPAVDAVGQELSGATAAIRDLAVQQLASRFHEVVAFFGEPVAEPESKRPGKATGKRKGKAVGKSTKKQVRPAGLGAEVMKSVAADPQRVTSAAIPGEITDTVVHRVMDTIRSRIQEEFGDMVLKQLDKDAAAAAVTSLVQDVVTTAFKQVAEQLKASTTTEAVGERLWAQEGVVLENLVRVLSTTVFRMIYDSIATQHAGDIERAVYAAIDAMPDDELQRELKDRVSDQVFGSHDAGWLSFYAFFRDYCDLKEETEKVAGLMELAKRCGWWAPYKNVCILQHRHATLHRDEENRLHNPNGMACRYRDGFGVWAIDGIRVDEQIIMRPETQTIAQIDGEENADVRAIRIDRFTWARYLKDSGAKCIDFRDNEVEGTKEALYRTSRDEVRLVATCATGRVFSMGVPANITKCVDAQSWLHGGEKIRIVGRT